ncbi:hypothetical protein GCM10023084_72600 [Streptomyces lacrimifluminis]|uniref:Transposase IS204/IS1001/IS1096/IS1165 DDE domain-containing protein n=1 Tax=Streptomyces lacrimifluminis TaxID=1500077 RepID=A0A917UK71_9ACTN|nr:hypothetical protein GCM10012282_70680 [Streptomyces lacrimifluminis]
MLRLYCENTACGKVPFAEQVPGLTVRYQRRTPLLQRVVEAAGVLLAGRGGARMLRVLNVTLSRCTVLSQLMRMPLPPLVTPWVLGVDDFALYGDTYGTLLVDATTRLPLTLWEGQDAGQLSRWLREHPGVGFVCRDGSLPYRQGISAGAPEAVQVSDRFHLWQGLSRRVQDIAAAHRSCLPAALPSAEEADPAPDEKTTENAAADTRAGQHAQRLFQAVHPGSLPRLPATTLGRGGTQRDDPPSGTPRQGRPRALPAREDGHRAPATRAAAEPAPRAPAVPA